MKTGNVLLILFGMMMHILAQPFSPEAISVPGVPSVSANGPSYLPVLSANRRFVVFVSSAKNITASDNLASRLDVFRHDLLTGETILISRSESRAGGANADSGVLSLSADGQWIAFASAASDLLPTLDDNGGSDVFLTDANSVSLVSATPDGDSPANAVGTRNVPLSSRPQLSADGRWIAFESFATNLTAEIDLNNESDVFLRDAANNQTLLVSAAFGGGKTASTQSELAGISADGNYVLFSSGATNLAVNGPITGYQELYLRDVTAGTTIWLKHTNTYPAGMQPPAPGNYGPYHCRWTSISSNGGFILYKVEFPSSPFARVHLYDRQNDTNTVVTIRAQVGTPIHMSPDARFIAYDETNQVMLWDRQLDTRVVVGEAGISHSPVVSDDGSIVAFLSTSTNAAFQIFYRNLLTFQLRRISETLSGGASEKDHNGSSLVVDPQGEFLLFDSEDDNLVPGDRNQASDVFVHDIASSETRLISRADENTVSITAVGSAGITNLCLSADGNRLLFFSLDSNLVPGDTNGWPDAFLRDLASGQTWPLSTNQNGLFSATNSARHGILSANGRYALLGFLAHQSRAATYGVPATIVRKDLDTGETVPILSVSQSGGVFLPPTLFFGFSMSANGRWVTYPSGGMIMVADVDGGTQTNITPSGSWTEPVVSPDGRYVTHVNTSSRELAITDLLNSQRRVINTSHFRGTAFSQDGQSVIYGAAPNAPPGVYVYSVVGASNTLVCSSCANAAASSDARFVTYEKAVSGPRQIELNDLFTGKTTLVTRNIFGTGAGNADAVWPAISADGRYVAYTSKATNLTTDVPNGWNNLYVYDRLQGTTVRITGSRGNTGYGSGSASRPVLGPNGRTLVFQSFASDFVANDFNDTRDIFLLTLGSDDSDNDGMPDDWEQTHFSTTDRDGTGDYDQDGQSDLAEYLAGTNPNNNQSVLEVLQITSVGSGQRQLIWSAQPGKSYRLEYKPDLGGATWTSLGQIITATQPTASATDTLAGSEKRFYRVALVE